jgi:hypothetical protein
VESSGGQLPSPVWIFWVASAVNDVALRKLSEREVVLGGSVREPDQ